MTVKLYRAKILDTFQHGSTRLWEAWDQGGGSCSVILENEKFVKMGENSLKWTITTGDPQSGAQSLLRHSDYYGTPMDLSEYTRIYMLLYSLCTSSPALKLRLRNNGDWSTLMGFSNEVKNGWSVVYADISAKSRTLVDQLDFTITESEYGAAETIKFYFDAVCLVNTNLYFDFEATDEDLSEDESFGLREVPFQGGLAPSYVMGRIPRDFSISGLLPTKSVSNTALIQEASLEDLFLGENSYFLDSDLVSIPVKVASYTATLKTGEIDAINYTVGLIENFGEDRIIR